MGWLNRKRVAVLVVAVLVASTAIVSSGSADKTLVIADADSGEQLLEIPVDDGDEVVLSYTHSVEKTPVRDVYVVNGSELRMDRTVFRSYGAGLPANAPTEQTDDDFIVRTDSSYEKLTIAPGSIAGHELIIGNEHYDLVALSEGSVVVYLTDRSVADALPLNISVVPKYDI